MTYGEYKFAICHFFIDRVEIVLFIFFFFYDIKVYLNALRAYRHLEIPSVPLSKMDCNEQI